MHKAATMGAAPGLSTTRLEALVDGVFAVAMTLLVLTLAVPREPAGLSSSVLARRLGHDLYALRFTGLSYAISFVIAAVYWVGHHNQFAAIRRTDRVLIWINILFLMGVTGIPFSTALLGAYPEQQIAVVIYGANLTAIGLVLYGHWRYATHRQRLTERDLDPLLVQRAARRILVGPTAYLVAVTLSYLSPVASIVIYALVPVYYILPGRVDRHLHIPILAEGEAGHARAPAKEEQAPSASAPE